MRGTTLLQHRLESLAKDAASAAVKAGADAGQKALSAAMKTVPVRTGYLRSTLQRKANERQQRIFTRCHYALYVEKGTRRMKAQPYLVPSVLKADYFARVTQALREAMK